MKILIVEDEPFASLHLEHTLKEIDNTIQVLARLDTVKETVQWLKNNTADLIFLDIQLADDISFKIFEEVEVLTPIIFTTAYSEYTLRAFQHNSIAYLLKPINRADLENILQKNKAVRKYHFDIFKEFTIPDLDNINPKYKNRFLVTSGGKLKSIPIQKIAYFEAEGRYVYLIRHDERKHIINQNLSDLVEELNPKLFIRLNRSFIVSFDAIQEVRTITKGRLEISLAPFSKREIIVSSANSKRFKKWMGK